MARVVETDEPAVVREERVEHIHEGRGGAGTAIAVIIVLLIIAALIWWWSPWSGAGSADGTTNINVSAPAGTSGGSGR